MAVSDVPLNLQHRETDRYGGLHPARRRGGTALSAGAQSYPAPVECLRTNWKGDPARSCPGAEAF